MTIGFPVAIGTRHFQDKQTTMLACEQFKTDKICKVCKNETCFEGGKKFDLIKPYSQKKGNYQQLISIYPPDDGKCYFNITYNHLQDSKPTLQERLYINETAGMQSCSELGNWSITKPCVVTGKGACNKYKKYYYYVNSIKGMTFY